MLAAKDWNEIRGSYVRPQALKTLVAANLQVGAPLDKSKNENICTNERKSSRSSV